MGIVMPFDPVIVRATMPERRGLSTQLPRISTLQHGCPSAECLATDAQSKEGAGVLGGGVFPSGPHSLEGKPDFCRENPSGNPIA